MKSSPLSWEYIKNQVKIDSSQSDVNSYATKVTAPAGAALTVDGTIPLYRPAQPSFCNIRFKASNIFLYARCSTRAPYLGCLCKPSICSKQRMKTHEDTVKTLTSFNQLKANTSLLSFMFLYSMF